MHLPSQNSRNPVVLCITHKDIACTEAGYAADTWNVTPLTIGDPQPPIR